MSRSKELWQAECDRICEDYANGKLTYDEASILLKQHGWQPDDIDNELAEWAAS